MQNPRWESTNSYLLAHCPLFFNPSLVSSWWNESSRSSWPSLDATGTVELKLFSCSAVCMIASLTWASGLKLTMGIFCGMLSKDEIDHGENLFSKCYSIFFNQRKLNAVYVNKHVIIVKMAERSSQSSKRYVLGISRLELLLLSMNIACCTNKKNTPM